jgi:glycosyltransferase involved in cell wall biosynthesis
MEPPWILALCHELPPLGGGAGKNLFLLCRELKRRGIQVRVWTADPGKRNRWKHEFEVEYIPTSRLERFETTLQGMAGFIFGACGLAWRQRRRRPVLVLSCLGIPAGLAGIWISRLLKAPHAVWHHGSDIHAGRPDGPGLLQRFLLRRVWGSASATFFVSAGLRDMAARLGRPRRPGLLPACPSPEILALPAASVPAPEGPYFLFLGRFDPVKNPLLALEAMGRLKAENQVTMRLRMVGSGALAEEVQYRIRLKTLTAFVAQEPAAAFEKVPELLRSAYALIVPSRIEGFNTTILEAAHFGVPAIASDTPGIRDFVTHEGTGLLFPENDAGALAAAMRRLAADPSLREALGARAREAAAPYRPERVADAFLSALETAAPALGARPREAAAWI